MMVRVIGVVTDEVIGDPPEDVLDTARIREMIDILIGEKHKEWKLNECPWVQSIQADPGSTASQGELLLMLFDRAIRFANR